MNTNQIKKGPSNIKLSALLIQILLMLVLIKTNNLNISILLKMVSYIMIGNNHNRLVMAQ